MARSGPAARTLLAKFEAIAEAVEPGETFNLTEFAALLQMSLSNFRKTYLDLDPEFPFLKIGHEGNDYEIDGRAGLLHLADRQRERIFSQDGRAARIAALAGIKPTGEAQDNLTVEEAQKIERIQDAQFKRRLAMQQLVTAIEHRRIVGDLCRAVGDRLGSIATEIDPAGLWSGTVRHDVVFWAKKLRIEIFDQFGSYLSDDERRAKRNRTRVPKARKR